MTDATQFESDDSKVFELTAKKLGNSVAIPVTGEVRTRFAPRIKAGKRLLSVSPIPGVLLHLDLDNSAFGGVGRSILKGALSREASKMVASLKAGLATELSPGKIAIESDPLTAVLLEFASRSMSKMKRKNLPDFDPASFREGLPLPSDRASRKMRTKGRIKSSALKAKQR